MSNFLDRLTFFNKYAGSFSDGHGVTTREDRDWEKAYRDQLKAAPLHLPKARAAE